MKRKTAAVFSGLLLVSLLLAGRVFAGSASIKTTEGSLVLENQSYLCEISTAKGLRWKRMLNKQTGSECLYPDGNSPVFALQGKKVSLDSRDFIPKDIKIGDNGAAKTVAIILASAKPQVEAVLKVEVGETDQMLWSLSFKNNDSTAFRLQPVFPIVARVNIDKDLKNTRYFFPWRSGAEGSIDCDLAAEYGDMGWMQVIAAYNPASGAGIYAYPEDKTGGFKGMVLKKLSPDAETIVREQELVMSYEMPKEDIFDFDEGLGFAYYYPEKEVAPGADYQLPETVLSICRGGWKEALKDYTAWAHTWYKHVDTPQWFKDCFSYIACWPNGFYSDSDHKYIFSENLKGSEHITQWAYWDDTPENDGKIPTTMNALGDFEYNRYRGGLKAFKEEIQKSQARGCHFTVYIDHRFCGTESKVGRAHGKEWAAMDRPGNYTDLGVYAKTGVNGWSECFYEPDAWADYIAQTCGRIVKDTGMDGIYLDELMIGFPCYNPDHKHYQQDKFPYNPQRLIQNAVKSRDAMRKENPQAILMTEHAGSDYYTQFFDGSWSQTYYAAGFPFAEKYFNEYSLNYFRFCFPEFKLAEWGESPDQVNRCFFSGTGRCGGLGGRINQVMKENGDAFASLNPEPLVETKVKNLLANKFPTSGKTVYTLYNKSGQAIDQEIIEVDPSPGCHYVELVNDNAITPQTESAKGKDLLSLRINAGEVLCIGQLPVIITAGREGELVKISLPPQDLSGRVLFAFMDADGGANAQKVDLKEGKGEIDVQKMFGHKGKLILKLFRGDTLVDELVMEL